MKHIVLKMLITFSVLIARSTAEDNLCEGLPDATMLPVKDDCHSFYTCVDEELSEPKLCPGDMFFIEDGQNCIITDDHCETTTDLTTEPTTEPTTDPIVTDLPIHEDCKDLENSEEIIFFPSKTDCASYYFCYDGQPEKMTCLAGMYWDQAAQRCEWSENVECLIEPTTQLPTTTLSPEICPESDKPVFVPSTTHCGEYYLCYNGNPQLLKCADDMYWNPETLQCDYPINVDCEISLLPKCPETGVYFYPHPEICTQYVSCSYGTQTIVNCPFSEIWDIIQNKCLTESLATCVLD